MNHVGMETSHVEMTKLCGDDVKIHGDRVAMEKKLRGCGRNGDEFQQRVALYFHHHRHHLFLHMKTRHVSNDTDYKICAA